MDQEFPRLLQKYNITPVQKTLSERLNEPDRFKNFSKYTGALSIGFLPYTDGFANPGAHCWI